MTKTGFEYRKSTYDAYDAQRIVFEAGKYKSEILITDGAKRVNAKSIIGLLSMKFRTGTEYFVLCEGPDERAAARGMSKYLGSLEKNG